MNENEAKQLVFSKGTLLGRAASETQTVWDISGSRIPGDFTVGQEGLQELQLAECSKGLLNWCFVPVF